MFNPHPQIQRLAIDAQHSCFVVDDALRDPQAWIRVACEQAGELVETGHNAYPGPELRLPDGISARLDDYFSQHFRSLLGARRIERSYSRLALITRPPEQLQPRQWICHRDRMDAPDDKVIGASVLYLFDNPALGGTCFFRPRNSEAETAQLVHDSGVLPAAEFNTRYGIRAGYMTESNEWFELTQRVNPRFNRLIVYPGTVLHGADIRSPQLLSVDPALGRLTWNGFFTCTRKAI